MADESRNPGDNAELRRLEGEMRGLVGNLRADLDEARGIRQEAADEERRSKVRAERESQARRRRTGGAEVPADTPEAVGRTANEAERLAKARERAARAAKEAERSTRSEAQVMQAQRLALPRAGGTAGGYQGGLTSEEVRQRAERRGLQTGGVRGPGYGPPGSPPLPPPAPPTGGGSGRPDVSLRDLIQGRQRAKAAVSDLGEEESREAIRARQLVNEQAQLENAMQRSTRAIGLSSNQFQRHGYLTSEFINAARKGQVTFRELGDQVTGTIGKFAGWTVAATATFGVVGAVAALGRGAIESNRGVNQLSRVITSGFNTDEAQAQFRALAHEMNLPISEVVDAAYGMSKVFNDQGSALKATREALFAVKVGELDAASATRYLTSIVQGFGLSAEELPDVFDAINQAQNRFGGNVGQITAGVAKAAGSFKLAGGSYRELIALITEGARLTGTSGENVGTAISRSASVVLTEAGQKRLKAAGLDPSLQYPQLLAQAFDKAHGASRNRVSEIARALVPAGGQFARVFVPLLENAQLYNKIMGEISPEKAKGSATRELNRTLHSFTEQLHQVLNNLEQMGSALAQSGGLDLLGAGVVALNTMLHTTTELLGVFNAIPRPLRDALAVMGQIYLVTRLLRRFDVGASLPVGAAGQGSGIANALRRPVPQRQRAEILSGLGAEQRFLTNEREATAQRAGLAQYQLIRSTDRHAALLKDGAAAQEDVERSSREVVRREQEAARLMQDERDLADRLAVVRSQERDFARQRVRSEEDVHRAARQSGIAYSPGTLERTSATHPVPVGGPDAATTIIPRNVTGAVDREGARYTRAGEAVRRASADVRGFAQRTQLTNGAVAGALQVAGTSVLVAGRGIGSVGKGIFAFARSAAAMLGPLDILLIGIGTFAEVQHLVKQRLERQSETIARLDTTTGGAGAIKARAQDVLNKTTFGDKLTNAYADFHNAFADRLPFGLGGGHLDTPDRQEKDLARRQLALAASINEAQSHGTMLYLPQIQANLARALGGAKNREQRQAAINAALEQLDHSYARTLGGAEANRAADALRDKFIAQLNDIKAAGSKLTEIMAAIQNESQLSTFTSILQNRITLEGPTKANAARAGAAAARGRELAAQTSDPAAAAKLLQDAQNAEQALQQAAEKRLNALLAVARNPQDQYHARRQYLGEMRQALGLNAQQQRLKELQDGMKKRAGAIAQLEKEADAGPHGTFHPLQPLDQLGGLGNPLEQLRLPDVTISPLEAAKSEKLRKLRQQQVNDRKAVEALRKSMGVTRQEFKAIEQEQRKAQAEAELAAFDARTGVLQSRTADPLAQARILASRLSTRVGIVRANLRKHLATEDELNQAIAQQNSALQQVAQARIQQFQSQQELSSARFALTTNDQGAVLRRSLADAQAFASFVQGQGSKVDPNTLRSALTAVATAQKAVNDYVRQQAEAMVQARAELALAQTDDPVAEARIRAREAQNLVRFATDPADRIKRRASALRAGRDLKQARAQSKFDDIEFQRDMDQITATTEISMLQGLLHMHGLTKEFRRNVMRRIKAVRDELNSDAGSFDLNVGDIRIPTTYEIRRAMKGGGSPNTVQVTHNNRISLEVSDGADVEDVFNTLDRITGSSVAANARSAGVTG